MPLLLQNVCGISVVKDYFRFRRFNLQMINEKKELDPLENPSKPTNKEETDIPQS
jgi:hypothetical protein